MKRSYADVIYDLKNYNIHTKNLEKILKDLFKLSEDGIKSIKVDKLKDDEIAALSYLGYTIEYHENDAQLAGGNYYIINGMF